MQKQAIIAPLIPNWVIWPQAICFSVLYAIWALPETILIRHFCLILGALLSLGTIYQYRNSFFQRSAIPVWLIVALFAWSTFHLFFLSNDFDAQYEEYTSIWKRTAIGAIFALGFGLALFNNKQNLNTQKALWALIYFGLLAPMLIYIIKFTFTHMKAQWGIAVPDYWLLYTESSPFYIPKTTYVCFCVPTLGVSLGQLANNINNQKIFSWSNGFYFATVLAILFVFYEENIKNGVASSAILIVIFLIILFACNLYQNLILKILFASLFAGAFTLYIGSHVAKNNSWHTLLADFKIATATQLYSQWKYGTEQGLPDNELGMQVSGTNYQRIAWGKVGLQLIKENPYGYGLIQNSFGRLAKIVWPESKLSQSHSGWIDLALGIGIPGLLLILIPLMWLIYNHPFCIPKVLSQESFSYDVLVWWLFLSLLILWSSTEVSQKIYFDQLIFWLFMGIAINIRRPYLRLTRGIA